MPLLVINPPGDKYSRALATAEMWNNSEGEGPRLMVPSPEFADRNGLNWVDDFVYEVTSFTGVNDPHDAAGGTRDALGIRLDCFLLRPLQQRFDNRTVASPLASLPDLCHVMRQLPIPR